MLYPHPIRVNASGGLGLEDNQWHYSEILDYVRQIPREQDHSKKLMPMDSWKVAVQPRRHRRWWSRATPWVVASH